MYFSLSIYLSIYIYINSKNNSTYEGADDPLRASDLVGGAGPACVTPDADREEDRRPQLLNTTYYNIT